MFWQNKGSATANDKKKAIHARVSAIIKFMKRDILVEKRGKLSGKKMVSHRDNFFVNESIIGFMFIVFK